MFGGESTLTRVRQLTFKFPHIATPSCGELSVPCHMMLPDRYRECAEHLHSAGPEGYRAATRLGAYRPCRFARAVAVFLAAKCSDVRGYDERGDRVGYPHCRFT